MTVLSDAALAHLQGLADWPDLEGTRYTAVEQIGRGGMGAVFRARDELLGRDVALKVVRTSGLPAELSGRLAREARILAGLEHPGIVPVHDAGMLPDGRPYYAMKLVRGTRLDRWLAEEHTLRERLDLFLRIAETIAFAHARGVIHRDLTPGNVMVGEFGEVLVLDWGVARRAHGPAELGADALSSDATRPESGAATGTAGARSSIPSTGHGTVLGTEGYMAPEQARGEGHLVDERADVFGLGVLLRGLAGASAPKRLAAIAARATAPDRDDRYRGAQDLVADVHRFLDGEPVSAYRENPAERLWRVADRYRTAIVLVMVYLLLRALFIIFAPSGSSAGP